MSVGLKSPKSGETSQPCVAFQVLPGSSSRSCRITTWSWRETAWKSWELNAGCVWPFIVVMDDSCVLWNIHSVQEQTR